MPLLPRRNNLDYNPNSIINASKTIKTIALENMKNPLLDPDMATLSSMDAERNLGINIDQLGQMYLDIERDIIKIAQFAGSSFSKYYKGLEGAGMCGGATKSIELSNIEPSKKKAKKIPANLIIEEDTEEEITPKRRGRPKGSKNKPKPSSLQSTAPAGSIRSISSSNPSISSRFSSHPVSSSGNSQAIPLYVGGDPDDSDYYPDDDASSLPSSASYPSSRTSRSMRSGRSIPNDPPIPFGSALDPNAPAHPTLPSIISNLLISLIQKVQRMDFFLTSRIKPAYQKINQKQQEKLSKIMEGINNLYKNVIQQELGKADLRYYTPNEPKTLERFIINVVDNGDELLGYLKTALDKLIVDLSVVLNSARRAGGVELELSPADNYALSVAGFTGDPRIDRRPLVSPINYRNIDIQTGLGSGRKPKMTGCGRNFYGDKINNTRDIPTIYRAYQNCPTKYLL